ncbi:hAT-like transposase, RNase-H fold [Sesbania bispinosa]|nr:hAT-like transposase, RNase-H fold [Sesbania bispinosa]
MTESMIAKFGKYLGTINEVMAIGVVLDPRYKMRLLTYFFPIMYKNESDNELKRVKKILEDLVHEYQARERKSVVTGRDSISSNLTSLDGGSISKKVD